MITAYCMFDNRKAEFHGTPSGIEPAAWAVLVMHLLDHHRGGDISNHVFNPKGLVREHLHKFRLGETTISIGNWAARLPE